MAKKKPGIIRRVFGGPWSIIFYALLCVLIFVVLIAVNQINTRLVPYLADYEENLPKYTVQSVFEQYFLNPDFDVLTEMAQCKVEGFNTENDLKDYFIQKTNGKEISYVYIAGSDKMKVNVKANGEKFASFAIKKSQQKSEHGFDMYELDYVKLFYEAANSVKIKIPFNYTVKVNGVTLGEEYKTKTNITDDLRDTIPEGTYKFSYDEYTVTDMIAKPVPTAFDSNGNEKILAYDEENKIYTADFEYSEELQSAHSAFVLKAVETYAARIQNASSMDEVKKYFEIGTPTYNRIKDNPGSFVWEYDSYDFENEYTGSFYAYSEDTFSCVVKMTQVMHKSNAADYRENINVTIYLRRNGNGAFMIYDLVTNL